MKNIKDINQLISVIQQTNYYFKNQAQKQVNVAMTLRNWVVGRHIVEYEQSGSDRAVYGNKILETLAVRLKQKGILGMAETNLKLFRQFYLSYPQIRQALSDELKPLDLKDIKIRQTLSDKSDVAKSANNHNLSPVLLLTRLSFSHFIELIKTNTDLQRSFYEGQTIKNNWGVRELKRAINSMLFERTGLSIDKQIVLERHSKEINVEPEDVFRNPYLLEFLGLEEQAAYTETELEQAIIDHLQKFLLEMGRGFCFEAKQKRITFDNTHYRIDLVFYQRILKCHVLIDLLCCAQHKRSYVATPVMCCWFTFPLM